MCFIWKHDKIFNVCMCPLQIILTIFFCQKKIFHSVRYNSSLSSSTPIFRCLLKLETHEKVSTYSKTLLKYSAPFQSCELHTPFRLCPRGKIKHSTPSYTQCGHSFTLRVTIFSYDITWQWIFVETEFLCQGLSSCECGRAMGGDKLIAPLRMSSKNTFRPVKCVIMSVPLSAVKTLKYCSWVQVMYHFELEIIPYITVRQLENITLYAQFMPAEKQPALD